MKRARYRGIALGLIAAFLASQFAWLALPGWQQFAGWTAGQGMYAALLLALVANAYRTVEMLLACALAGACALLTYACSAWWLHAPWIPKEGQDRCSAALDIPVGVLVSVLALWLAWHIYSGGRRWPLT